MRAQRPRRLGATMMMRPPGVRMRQISCRSSLGLSTVSRAWTTRTRSMEASGRGIINGSTRAEAEDPQARERTPEPIDGPSDEAARHGPEGAGVETAQIGDVDAHDLNRLP